MSAGEATSPSHRAGQLSAGAQSRAYRRLRLRQRLRRRLRGRLRRLGYQINDVGQTSTRVATGASALMVSGAIFLGGDDCIPAGPTTTPSSDTADETDVLSGPTVETLELNDTDLSDGAELEVQPASDVSDSDVGETGIAAMEPYRNVQFEVRDDDYESHDMLEIYLAAEEAYGVPWEVSAALAMRESTHGTAHGEFCNRNHMGAVGVMQMGSYDSTTCGHSGPGASSNAWGGEGYQTVEEREQNYPNETMPALGEIPQSMPEWIYFGIDGNGNGDVNVWDPWDNIMSATMKIAYFAERAEEYSAGETDAGQFTGGSENPDASPYNEYSPLEWGLWRHDAGDNIHDVLDEAAEDYGWDGESDIQANPVSYSGGGETEECLDPDMGEASVENANFNGGRLEPIEDCDPADADDAASYENGQIPESALCDIGGGETLRPDAAVAFMQLDEAYEEALGEPIVVNDAYRDLAGQEYQYQDKGPGWAAVPGTSNHGWGLAIDINDVQYEWMSANAGQFGWHHPEDLPHEPWHWEFEPENDAEVYA